MSAGQQEPLSPTVANTFPGFRHLQTLTRTAHVPLKSPVTSQGLSPWCGPAAISSDCSHSFQNNPAKLAADEGFILLACP